MAMVELQKAQEIIDELRDQLDEQVVINELLKEDAAEWRARAKVLEGQLGLLRVDRRYVV